MKIALLPWDEAVARTGREWSALVSRCRVNPSLDPRWMDAVLRSHDSIQRAAVVVAHDGERLVGVLPFLSARTRIHGLPLNTIDLCSNLVSYHPELVASGSHAQMLHAALDHAHGGKWDLLRMDNIPGDSPTIDALRSVAALRKANIIERPGEASPFIAIEGTWEGFLGSRSKKFRANVTRAVRRMKEQGETGMQWFGPGDDTDTLLRYMLEIEQRSWKADTGSAITNRAVETDYYNRLLPVLSAMDALFANVLLLKDIPVAYVLCCKRDGWTGQLKTSFDKDIADAGARVIDESVRCAFESGANIYDFLGDAAPHKLKWTDRVRQHQGYWLLSSRPIARAVWLGRQLAARWRVRREAAAASSNALTGG